MINCVLIINNYCDHTFLLLVSFVGQTLSITSSSGDRRTVIVLDGSTITLSCSGNLSSAINDPSLLSIIWYHDGTMVELTSNVSLSNDGATFTNTLAIDPFTISSVGSYRCVAMIDDSIARSPHRVLRGKRKYNNNLLLFIIL